MLENLWFLLFFPGLPIIGLIFWMRRWVRVRNEKSRRPFKDMPRPPGWSLQSRTEHLMADLLLYTTMVGFAGFVAWLLYVQTGLLSLGLGFGVIGTAVFFHLLRKTLRKLANHRLGLQGEQIVGGVLDRLSSDGLRVFHDLEVKRPGAKPWNIDHVALTPAGVFVFETKARRKPKLPSDQQATQKNHEVVFDGVHLHFPRPMGADAHGIKQASRNAAWLTEKLTALNGTDIPVSAALVLPGWYVTAKAKGAVAVLNEKLIRGYLSDRPAVFSEERLRALNAQLTDMAKVEFE